MSTPRLTKPTIAVLEVLLASTDDAPAWGLSICRDADLGSGTVYPILERLRDRGWVTTRTEEEPHPGRPPRTYYSLSSIGRAESRVALAARAARQHRAIGFAGGAA